MRAAWRVEGGCWPRMLPWHFPGSGENALPRGCALWNRPKCSELLLTLPALGWGCREGMAGGGGGEGFLLRHIKSPSWGSSGQSLGARSGQPLVRELAGPGRQRSREGSRLMRSWLTGDGPGLSPPLPILVGTWRWEEGFSPHPSGEGPENGTIPVALNLL